jgi:hypothetical protein
MHGNKVLLLVDKLGQPCHAGFELLDWASLVKLLSSCKGSVVILGMF